MNKTQNYSLNQWEAEDRVLRTDFNADNAKIDAAIKAVDSRVDALTTLVGVPLRVAWGSYIGEGEPTKTIEMGFRPVFARIFRKDAYDHVFVLQGDQAEFMSSEPNQGTWKANNEYNDYKVVVQDTGVFMSAPNPSNPNTNRIAVACNAKNGKYVWFAIGT